MEYLSIKNWKRFQHFKDRKPPWIKLYRDLLDDLEWHELDPKAAKALVMIWLLASEDEGRVQTGKDLAFRLRMSEKELSSIIPQLYHWFTHDDINTISTRYQHDTPETETETETEGETETEIVSVPISKFSLPEWFKEEDWQLFISHRKGLKCPISKGSFTAFIKKFDAWRSAGYDPHFVIDTLVERGWRSFKPEWVEDKNGNKKGNSAIRDGLARFLTEEDDDPRDKYRK